MNAQPSRPTRAQQQAVSAPFLIEDQDVVLTIARLADERGTAMQEIVKLAVEDYLSRHKLRGEVSHQLQKFWDEHPLPLPTGLKADKRFYDSLNDEL